MPDVATKLFPEDRLATVEQYAAWLADAGVVRGLIGPREVPRLWDRHILNCAVPAELIPGGVSVADIGSGAGLPGLVLAIARPDLRVTLIEPLLRRTTFLEEAVEDLEIDQVTVLRGKAEAFHGELGFDVVTSRAVAGLGKLLDWSMPLVVPTGALIAMKGSSIEAEIVEASAELKRWGCATPTVSTLGEGLLESTTTAVRVAWADPASVDWPPVRRAEQSQSGSRRKGKKRR